MEASECVDHSHKKRPIDCTHRVRDFSCCISIVVGYIPRRVLLVSIPTSLVPWCYMGLHETTRCPKNCNHHHSGKNVDELSNVWTPHFFNIRVPSLIYLQTNDGLSSTTNKKMVNLYIAMKNHRVGKSTISIAMFNGKLLVYQVVYTYWWLAGNFWEWSISSLVIIIPATPSPIHSQKYPFPVYNNH